MWLTRCLPHETAGLSLIPGAHRRRGPSPKAKSSDLDEIVSTPAAPLYRCLYPYLTCLSLSTHKLNIFYLKITKGFWGDGSVGKVPVVQAQRPEFKSPAPTWRTEHGVACF